MSRTHPFLLLTLLPALLGGCAMGSSSYSCPGYPDGIQCESVRDVYKATSSSEAYDATSPQAHREAVEQANAQRGDMLSARTFGPGPQRELPRPIRNPAAVMRVWHAPMEDHRGDLHMGGFSYTEVEKRRWAYGEIEPTGRDARTLRLNPQ